MRPPGLALAYVWSAMTILLAFCVFLVLVIAYLAARWVRTLDLLNAQVAATDWQAAEIARMTEAAENAVVPMLWALGLQDIYDHPENAQPLQRATLYASQAIVCLQDLLDATDAEMGEVVKQARRSDPPKRLPTRPQTPIYLATAETLAGVPLSRGTPGTAFGLDVVMDVNVPPGIARIHSADGTHVDLDLSLPADAVQVNAAVQVEETMRAEAIRRKTTRAEIAQAFDVPESMLEGAEPHRVEAPALRTVMLECAAGHRFEVSATDPETAVQVAWPCPTCSLPLERLDAEPEPDWEAMADEHSGADLGGEG